MEKREILKDKGILETLKSCGLLKKHAERNIALYDYYLEELRSTNSYTQAVINAADKFGIDDRQAYRVIASFKESENQKSNLCMN